ncbi:MAG TPA: hypothetical protein PLJ60_15155 [Chryseolinea sp.]|nr:hypothetical protein [Chryseolinea sp.]HPH45849.1 hypothetical protein [Chryseolinea sp.]HPM31671.1 hypothetical protein [Chryseolinea sp.]
MTSRKFLLAITFPILLLATAGCDLLESATDVDIEGTRLANEWTVDTVRVREYGFNPAQPPGPLQKPLASDTLLPVIRMRFTSNGEFEKGTLIETSLVNGVEVENEVKWRLDRGVILRLYYYNVGTNSYDIEVDYSIVELSDDKLHFERDANLVAPNGAQYGSVHTVKKMHR